MSKRCGNCGRYPFCNKIVNANYICKDWISKDCLNCLGCNRLEIEKPEDTKECKWKN